MFNKYVLRRRVFTFMNRKIGVSRVLDSEAAGDGHQGG